MLLPAKTRAKINSDERQAYLRTRVAKCTHVDGGIFEHLWWSVTNCHFRVTHLSLKNCIKVNIKVTVRNLSFFIAIHNVLPSASSYTSISVIIHIHTNVRFLFFFTKADSITSQNIDLSSRITLYTSKLHKGIWTNCRSLVYTHSPSLAKKIQRSSAAVQEFVSNYPPIRIRKTISKLH
jgi:hypothetical protein